MAGDVIQKQVKGLARSAIIDTTTAATPITLVLPAASQITYDTGIELGEAESVNCQGVRISRARYPVAEKPRVALTLPNVPETVALKLNRKYATQTSVASSIFQSDYLVPSTGLASAKTSGTLGNGIAADVVSKMWALNSAGVTNTTALTQGTYASFDAAATPDGFAIGADMAMKFGNNLKGSTVSFAIPVTLSTLSQLGTSPYSSLQLKLAFVTIDGLSILSIDFPSVSVDSTGSINFNEPQTEVGFFVNGSPDIQLIPLANFC